MFARRFAQRDDEYSRRNMSLVRAFGAFYPAVDLLAGVTTLLFLEQTLNGLQLGVTLFLMAAGLTLVLGIMNMVNLAHGSFYMLGAYFPATLVPLTGNFLVAVVLALVGAAAVGLIVEIVALRTLYARHHLDQVLATFGLILFFRELVKILFDRIKTKVAYDSFLEPKELSGNKTLIIIIGGSGPLAASARASALPIPEEAPVTHQHWPANMRRPSLCSMRTRGDPRRTVRRDRLPCSPPCPA